MLLAAADEEVIVDIMKGNVLSYLRDLWVKHPDSAYDDLVEIWKNPTLLRASAKIKANALSFVPAQKSVLTCDSNDDVPEKAVMLGTLLKPPEVTKPKVFYLRKPVIFIDTPEKIAKVYKSYFWFVAAAPTKKDVNMSVKMMKDSKHGIEIPCLHNSKAIQPGTILYRFVDGVTV